MIISLGLFDLPEAINRHRQGASRTIEAHTFWRQSCDDYSTQLLAYSKAGKVIEAKEDARPIVPLGGDL